MRPTTWRLIATIAALSGAASFVIMSAWVSRTGSLPAVPWPTAVLLILLAGAVLVAALSIKPRLSATKDRPPMDPLVAVRYAALGLTSTRAGAFFVGAYGGFLLVALGDLMTTYRRHLALVCGLCVLAAVVLVVAGWLLERNCRLPPPESVNGESTLAV